jgi:hypothetical protein
MATSSPGGIPNWKSVFGQTVLLLSLTSAWLVACTNGHSPQRSTSVSAENLRIASPSPTPSPWPSYLAKEYDNPGHPRLTTQQRELIRRTMVRVRPCQLEYLRYAFPREPVTSHNMVLFFASTLGAWPHVLWSRNLFYKPDEGMVFAGSATYPIPKYNGIEYDVNQRACTPNP